VGYRDFEKLPPPFRVFIADRIWHFSSTLELILELRFRTLLPELFWPPEAVKEDRVGNFQIVINP